MITGDCETFVAKKWNGADSSPGFALYSSDSAFHFKALGSGVGAAGAAGATGVEAAAGGLSVSFLGAGAGVAPGVTCASSGNALKQTAAKNFTASRLICLWRISATSRK